MTDLKTQLRTYYEATTSPTDIDAIAIEPGTVVVGPVPEAARRRSAMSTEQPTTTRSWLQGSRAAAAALVATIAVIAAIVIATNDSGPDVTADRSPGAVLFAFQDAFNAGDLGETLDQFAAEAAVTGYPNLYNDSSFTTIIERELEDPKERFAVTEVEVEGSVVTFRHRSTFDDGTCRTAPGHRMVVEDGLIQSWEWPTTMAAC